MTVLGALGSFVEAYVNRKSGLRTSVRSALKGNSHLRPMQSHGTSRGEGFIPNKETNETVHS